jgi:hypothetical protein
VMRGTLRFTWCTPWWVPLMMKARSPGCSGTSMTSHVSSLSLHHDLGFYGKKGFERESTRIGDFIPAGPVPLFPQGCPFIPAGLSFYSRRAGAAAPGGI